MAADRDVSQLEPSELGRREYWDNAYAQELSNHIEDPNEEGTIWFSESGAEERILAYLRDLPLDGSQLNVDNSDLKILDLGTGNGHLLFALKDDEWKGHMTGVDYSDTSITLATRIKHRRLRRSELDKDAESICFMQWDVLRDEPGDWFNSGFDIVLDKGTFDAISLSDEIIENSRKGCEVYAEKVQRLVKDGGFLLLTSCNWTEIEIKRWFDVPELVEHGTIRFPHFLFGGIKGQAVSAVCFRKRGC